MSPSDCRCITVCFLFQGEFGGGHQRKTSGTLHLFNVTLEDDGIYVCVAHNPSLNVRKMSKPAKLTVQGEDGHVLVVRQCNTVVTVWLMSVRLSCRGSQAAADHPGPWQHHCCYRNRGLHALHCPRLPCSHGALVQKRLPPDELLGLVQPAGQWTAAHIQVGQEEYSFFIVVLVFNCNDGCATWTAGAALIISVPGMWRGRTKAFITVKHQTRKRQSSPSRPSYFQLVL